MAIANRHGGRRPSRLKADRTVLSVFTYSYDNAGNRTGVQEASGDRVTWSYDSSYQLTREQRSGTNAYDVTYSYDAAGNRLTKLESGTTTTYSYDNANQLSVEYTPSARTTHTYDANGNTTVINPYALPGRDGGRRPSHAAGSRTTYTWDIGDHITAVQLPGGARNTYTYDGQGKRRQRQDSEGTRNLVWDSQNIVSELDGSNNTVAAYTLAPQAYGNLISQRRSGATSFHHFDALGSTDRLTNSAQSALVSYLYRAFGEQSILSGSATNPFTWVGQLGYYRQADTSDFWVRARVYRPQTGRWVSRDPMLTRGRLALLADNPLYRYSESRPPVACDPSGEIVPLALVFALGLLAYRTVTAVMTVSEFILAYWYSTACEECRESVIESMQTKKRHEASYDLEEGFIPVQGTFSVPSEIATVCGDVCVPAAIHTTRRMWWGVSWLAGFIPLVRGKPPWA